MGERAGMGYQTDFVGYLHVQPALNESEIALVNAIARRPNRLDYGALRTVDDETAARFALETGMPNGWSNWEACAQGCCLSYDGGDKANHMVPWLKYLLSTYLVPGAQASGKAGYDELTCDHFVNGMVVGSRRDNRQLYSITVRENEVSVELLWPGVPEWSDYPPLGYQVEIDRFLEWRAAYRLGEARARARQLRAEAEQEYGGE
jgi:hypothetical protein